MNCKEHVSDSETDSQTEEDTFIENKAFPQQRFSPVMKHISASDITYRPKPIKRIPESPLKGDIVLNSGCVLNQEMIQRPSSTGSNFQPTGAVFKAKPKHPRIMSTGSVPDFHSSLAGSDSETHAHANEHHVHSSSISSGNGKFLITQQPTVKLGQMKIHNITMTMEDKQQIIVSSNTETVLGKQNGKGPILGKITQKTPKSLKSLVQQPVPQFPFHPPNSDYISRPSISSNVQILSTNQPVVTNINQMNISQMSVVDSTYSTTRKPISTPVLIASKPMTTLNQSGLTIPTNIHPQVSGVGVTPHTVIQGLQSPNNAHLSMHSSANGNLKNLSTVVLQPIPNNPYGMTLLKSANINKMAPMSPVNPTSMAVTSVTSQNPAHLTNMSSQNLPAVVTLQQQAIGMPQNIVLKPTQPALQTPAINISPSPATHVQFLLPSVKMAPSSGKVQNIPHMALSGTAVPPGSHHLALLSRPQTPVALQSQMSPIQPQGSPQALTASQSVQPKKIQLAQAQPGLKMTTLATNQNKVIAHQLSQLEHSQPQLASQTLQVVNQTVHAGKTHHVPIVTQIMAVSQAPHMVAPAANAQQLHIPASSINQPVMSLGVQPSHLQSQLQHQLQQSVQNSGQHQSSRVLLPNPGQK